MHHLRAFDYCFCIYWTFKCNMRQWVAILCSHCFKTTRFLLVMQHFRVVYCTTWKYCITTLYHAKENAVANRINAAHSWWWRHGKVRDNGVKYTTGFLYLNWLYFPYFHGKKIISLSQILSTWLLSKTSWGRSDMYLLRVHCSPGLIIIVIQLPKMHFKSVMNYNSNFYHLS